MTFDLVLQGMNDPKIFGDYVRSGANYSYIFRPFDQSGQPISIILQHGKDDKLGIYYPTPEDVSADDWEKVG